MQQVSEAFLEAVKGSHTPTIQVDAWYGGRLVHANLPIAPGASVSVDADRRVQGQVTGLVVVDPDGLLEPRSEDSGLAPYGSRLHVTAGVVGASERVSLGWFRIVRSQSRQQWHAYTLSDGYTKKWVTRGGAVSVDGDDLMWQVVAERFLAPEAPASPASAVVEIRRLLRGLIPLGTVSVPDRTIPASVVYEWEQDGSRASAVEDLITAMGGVPRMSPDGALDVVSRTPGPPVWSVAIGEGGCLVDASTELLAEDLFNAAVSTGTSDDGLPVAGTATETAGPLRFGGPHGRVPVFHASPLLKTTAAAQSDAVTTLRNNARGRAQTLNVVCVPNPALQIYDVVTVVTPAGSVDGQVRAIRYPLSPGAMSLRVVVPRAEYLALWEGIGTG